MEPSPQTIDLLLGPAIIYIPEDELETVVQHALPKDKPVYFRADHDFSWRLFRADFVNRKIFAVPKFALGRMPLGISIRLSRSIDLQAEPWQSMRPSYASMLSSNGGGHSALADHILTALGIWSEGFDNFESIYMNLQFGSSIRINTLAENPREMSISLEARYEAELAWLTPNRLAEAWGLDLPPAIPLADLELVSQLHESVYLVTLKNHRDAGQMFVFKSSPDPDPRFLYHELRLLLTTPPHPYLINGPLYLVTKRVSFGGKRGVAGFLLEYHPAGTLGACLKSTRDIPLNTKVKWACQLTSALEHIVSSSAGYYPDLKLDNILLKHSPTGGGGCDTVLIDFEQRGSWVCWNPPEVNHITLLLYLAARKSRHIPRHVAAEFQALLDKHLPSWRISGGSSSDDVSTSILSPGYNKTWRSLSADERESAMVFMLGRVLWCIFEGVGSSTGGNSADFLGGELFRDGGNGDNDDPNQQRFPAFRDTPEAIQVIIREATRGAMDWTGLSRCVRVVGDRVYDAQSKMNGDKHEEAYDAARALRTWWNARISSAKEYLVKRAIGGEECEAASAARSRPRLGTVLRALHELEMDLIDKSRFL
ncbi:hypothetical protein BDW67DRAFT_181477 [Aspergillus spinulosporus]